jgi:hypothetical protein
MAEVYLDEDEMYLGEATLAKLRAGELEFAEEAEAEPEWVAPEDLAEPVTSAEEEPQAEFEADVTSTAPVDEVEDAAATEGELEPIAEAAEDQVETLSENIEETE